MKRCRLLKRGGGAKLKSRRQNARNDLETLYLMQADPEPAEGNAQIHDLVTIGFVTLDRQGRIRQLNQKTARLLGFSSSRLVQSPFLVYVATHDVGRFVNLLIDTAR